MTNLLAAEFLKLRTTRTAWALLAATVGVSALAVLYAALFGAVGAATGSLVRNQVAAIVGWLAWFAVVEHITVGLFPAFGRWLPFAAGSALLRSPNSEKLLAPLTAAVVLTAYEVRQAEADHQGDRLHRAHDFPRHVSTKGAVMFAAHKIATGGRRG